MKSWVSSPLARGMHKGVNGFWSASTTVRTRLPARAQHVFEATLLESGDGGSRDHATVGHHTDPTDGEAAAQAINDRNEHADIGGVAGPHLRADRPARGVDHHAHDHLHEVGAVVLG